MDLKKLDYFVGKVCTVLTGPTNWKLDQKQTLDYFLGVVESIDNLGVVLVNVINNKKTYIFSDSLVAIAEETVVDPNDQQTIDELEEYQSQKNNLLNLNPRLQPKIEPVAPVSQKTSCGSSCGSSKYVDIESITNISNHAKKILNKS